MGYCASTPPSANSAQAANSDPNYRALRDGKLGESYAVSNLTLQRDVGTFTLKNGRVTFLQPVLDRVVMGVFTGEGEFTLTPGNYLERGYLQLLTEKETVQEAFDRMVLCFTDETYQEVRRQGQGVATDQRAEKVLGDFRKRVQRLFPDYLLQVAQLAGGAPHLQLLAAVAHGDPCRVITAILQPLQPLKNNGNHLFRSQVADYPAHFSFSPFLP